MTMRRLDLDFEGSSQKKVRARGRFLLLLGATLWGIFLLWYGQLNSARESLLAERGQQDTTISMGEAGQAVQKVLDSLSIPWGRLFRALETARDSRVMLDEVIPDPKNSSVQIVAHGESMEAVVAYWRALEQAGFKQVVLGNHERPAEGEGMGVVFKIGATWPDR